MDNTNPAEPTGVFNVFADGEGWFLAATGPGLIRFRPESGERRFIPSPKDSKEIISLCRDGQGRLWAASNDHVYLSSDEGTHWEPLDLPMLSYVDTVLIRPNQQNENGIVFTLSDRGIVFLEW
jgi:ligand-binding sensor domain-containing protein